MTISGSVWRNLKIGLAMLMTGALLAACGGGESGPPSPTAACDAGFQTILKSVAAATPAAVTGKKTVSAVPEGTLRIHYKRTEADYAGWNLYTYNPEVMGGWPGAAHNAAGVTGTDDFGVYWDVPVGTAASINFIINFEGGGTREPSNWSGANADQQQYWEMSGGNEIWKLQGDATHYTADPTNVVVDVTKVRVHYKRYDGQYDKYGLHMWDGSGIDTAALTEAGVALPGWEDAANFSAMPGYQTTAFGISFEIPVINPTVSEGLGFEFIIHGDGGAGGDPNNKDGWSANIKPQFLAMTVNPETKVADVWLVQENTTIYYAVPDLRSVSTTDAKAFALTSTLMKWPRVDASGSFKLYYATQGGIKAVKGGAVTGAEGSLDLEANAKGVPDSIAERFKFVPPGVILNIKDADVADGGALLKQILTKQLVLVQLNAEGKVENATTVQLPGALDHAYAAAKDETLGVTVGEASTTFKVWAPTAQTVALCVYDTGTGSSTAKHDMTFDANTGVWSFTADSNLSGKYYKYMVTVFVRGVGLVRNLVTDPYSVSLTADSKRSYVADLNSPDLKPAGWDESVPPVLEAQEDMSIYELHVRDFSIGDQTVPAADRGKFTAFTHTDSDGMKHLKALADAGLTEVHLLPVFDIGTIPEIGCATPNISTPSDPKSLVPQETVGAVRDQDCFNWGYDPVHYTALEGSYSTDPRDGAARVKEFRAAVMAMHNAGLRVGLDVVYNHTNAAGQAEKSVLDRIVPGYYHRYSVNGDIERSTCCDNTATENLMMGKLMIDSVVTLAKEYKLDSFRFDLMAHQPRSVMEELKTKVDAATGRNIFLVGEGWNFGEVANGARFVQASQLSLNGSGIGTFSDRARDSIRGGGPFDGGLSLRQNQGFVNGLYYAPNESNPERTENDLKWANDMVKLGLAGSIRSYSLQTYDGSNKLLEEINYGGQPAGYVTDPQEVVNYVENHDNQTLFDINVYKLPVTTSKEDRARVQMLAAALNAFSQGVTYFHAGIETLRSKSMDRNSYNSGDWFNRLDWTYTDNFFGTGSPPEWDNGANYSVLQPLLQQVELIKPTSTEIVWTRDMFRQLLAVRKSSTLFRMRTADDVKSRLTFYNTGTTMEPTVVAMHLNGAGYAGANYDDVMVLVNVGTAAKTLTVDAQAGKSYVKHPALTVDTRLAQATYNGTTGEFVIPARTAVVWVREPSVEVAGKR